MVRGQGRPLSEIKVGRIKMLLATTDLSLPDIAERMGCARGRVVSINQKYQIRQYGNKRSSWVVMSSIPQAHPEHDAAKGLSS
jgi:hypothetical protein